MSPMARLSVVIPAHNEAVLIPMTLRAMLHGDVDERLEVVVVANGCTDDTVAAATAVSPRVRVIETDEASKIAALNAGDAVADVFPRAYIDADVTVSCETLLALADVLGRDDLPRVAAPRLEVDTSTSSWAVRSFYAIWELSEYRQQGHVGSGIYALSRSGRARWNAFPQVIADDRFVQQQFELDERVTLTDRHFTVLAPATMREHLRRSIRTQAGNRELPPDARRVAEAAAFERFGALGRRVLSRPRLWPAFAVYCFSFTVTRWKARRIIRSGQSISWNRDDSTRGG